MGKNCCMHGGGFIPSSPLWIRHYSVVMIWAGVKEIADKRPSREAVSPNVCSYVQIPLGGPDQTLSETQTKSVGSTRVSDKSAYFLWSGPCPCSGIWHGPTTLCRWSGLVVSFLNSTTRTGPDPTRHVCICDHVSDKVWSVSNSTLQTHGLCLRPDQTRPTDKVCTHWDWANKSTTRQSPQRPATRVPDKVWSDPSSGIWTLLHAEVLRC